MAKFRVYASSHQYFYCDIEARDEDEAYDIACQLDGADFICEDEDWNIDDVAELVDRGGNPL